MATEKKGSTQKTVTEKPAEPTEKVSTTPEMAFEELKTTTDVLLMLYPKSRTGNFYESIDASDELTLYEKISERREFKESLLILLDTGGGNVYSAVKMMDTLRTKYKHITIAVPQEAKSSGTMMCCGADNLIMTSISELGPLDKPMIHPNDENSFISALDIVKSIDSMLEKALEDETEYAFKIRKSAGISTQKAFEIASDSVSKLVSPMLCREDVKIYNQAKRLLEIANTYASELLNKHMFSYLKSDSLRSKVIKMVVRRLIWLYPDHGFAIRRDELEEWFFDVKHAEKIDYWPVLWKYFIDNVGSRSQEKVIKFI